MAHRAVRMEFAPVEAGDAGGFLPAMLERVQAQRDQCGGTVRACCAEDAALLVKVIVVERVRGQHIWGLAWCGAAYSDCRGNVIKLGTVPSQCGFPAGRGEDGMAKDHGPQVKDDAVFEALRKQGASKEKAARIANAKAAGTLDRKSTPLEDRTKADLYEEAKKIGIVGRSSMTKAQLADAIRDH
jgi:hypothetical protein